VILVEQVSKLPNVREASSRPLFNGVDGKDPREPSVISIQTNVLLNDEVYIDLKWFPESRLLIDTNTTFYYCLELKATTEGLVNQFLSAAKSVGAKNHGVSLVKTGVTIKALQRSIAKLTTECRRVTDIVLRKELTQ